MTDTKIVTVFNPILAREARDLNNMIPSVSLIPVKDFPKGVAIHPDGSRRYNPSKPLAYFAIELRSKRAIKAWEQVTRDFDERRRVLEADDAERKVGHAGCM
jgi:hypothetical protein